MAKGMSDRRQQTAAWLDANGIPARDVPMDADITIEDGPDGRVIRCEVCDLDADGRRQPDDTGTRVATTFVTVPLKTEPPAWWQPRVKPTRDQLLTAMEGLHALHRRNEHSGNCEHCSDRDYPDYAVPWPCETIRVLKLDYKANSGPGGGT
ncbi:hypothetical protein AB0G67_40315 [Streptomyces sp. NPDC021056]|uniref:hypothetical protein n=1 Tax=Streptomyces sp. NPDC021056 TaxID=3155012 RepID=UPI00340C99E7